MKKRKMKTSDLVLCAILTAFVVILQMMGSFLRFGPFQVSLVLVPIVIGALTVGIWGGFWLGLVFGIVVLLNGDAAPFLAVSPLGTVITVITKGILCGVCASLIYKCMPKLSLYPRAVIAAFVCPVVNTGIFLLCCLVFFWDTIKMWAGADSVWKYMLFVLVGGNFIFELLTNLVLSPVIVRLIKLKD